jgi:flagellar hook-basal body complex protein FliE
MSSMQIQQVLAEMRALQSRASFSPNEIGSSTPASGIAAGSSVSGTQPTDFVSLMKSSMDNIATMQNQAESMAASYEAGDKSMDITKVMLEAQKASLAFHAMAEVRNKLVDAYTTVMAMSV